MRFLYFVLGCTLCASLSVASDDKCPVVNPVTTYKPTFPIIGGMNWNGTVGVHFVIDKAGVPTSLKIVQSVSPGADKVVLGYIADWRFQAATKCNEPVEFPATVYTDLRSHH